jgi:SAM-dependent methyltransferase
VSRDHERRNRAFWDGDADAYQATHAPDLDRAPEAWGAWRIPESDVQVLGDVAGLDVLELGCGAAQWSVALCARGAGVTGIDISLAQLRHARRRAQDHNERVALVCGSGEAVPLRGDSFDLVFCDHGALSFCDPAVAVPECARLLRDGGRLVFCHSTPLLYLTWDPERRHQTRRLQTRWRDRWQFDSGEGTIDFVWSHGEWIRLFRANRFVVENLIELVPPDGATTTYTDFAPARWARRWPAEQIWCLTLRA